MSNLSEKVMKAFQKVDPTAFGSIHILKESGSISVSGSIHSDQNDVNSLFSQIIQEIVPGSLVIPTVENLSKKGLHVVVTENEETNSSQNIDENESLLDEIKVLYQGHYPTSAIKHSNHFKKENWNTNRKIEACINVVGFIAPIVLDSNLKVIDGDLRLSIAIENEIQKVPVIIIDDSGVKSEFLRLVLNRSSEFQRWNYPEVDEFVDSTPQAQPLLEPLGFFGERILPTSFFGQTIIDYKIYDEIESQQKAYKQEYGLAKWAEIQRERIQKEEAAKKAKRTKKPTSDTISLFDLMPKEEDFKETHNIKEEMDNYVQEMREVAGEITDNYDAVRKAEKEARGQSWQTTRRSPKQVIKEKLEELKGETNEDN